MLNKQINQQSAILLLGNFLSKHGLGRTIAEELCDRLGTRGMRVFWASQYLPKGQRLVDMLLMILRERKNYNVAIISVFSGSAFLWAEACAMLLKLIHKPVVLSLHGGGLPAYSIYWPGRVKRLLLSATAISTPSYYLLDAFKTMRPDIRLIPNGIELHNYSFRFREQPSPNLVWLRALHYIYNPVMAIDTLHHLCINHPNSKLLIVGPDKHDGSFDEVKKRINKFGLDSKVTFTGVVRKSEVPNYLDRGDIFINTTNMESFGVSVLEAAACGLGIVTTSVGELPYFWKDGENALLIPPNNPIAMAAAIERLLTEPGLAGHLSMNARKKAEEYDWSTVLPQWEDFLSDLQYHD